MTDALRLTTAGPRRPPPTARARPSNVRIRASDRALIDQAAAVLNKSRTDFVIDAARRAAEDALLDRTLLTVSPEAYAAFLERLDAPPQPNDALVATMRAPAPWDLALRDSAPRGPKPRDPAPREPAPRESKPRETKPRDEA